MSKFKHIEDDGDLSLLISDSGEFVVVCSQGHKWTGELTPYAQATRSPQLAFALRENPMVLHNLALDDDQKAELMAP
jgi:hypothetical protein